MGHGARIEISARRYYWPGDVIAFLSDRHGFVSHRVIGYRLLEGRFHMITKSDQDNEWDPPVPVNLVLGRVTGGDCTKAVRQVPLSNRTRAIADFCGLMLSGLANRLRSLSERAAHALPTD